MFVSLHMQEGFRQSVFVYMKAYECRSYLVVDGDGAQAVQEQQQGGVHVMKQVSGLMALGAQGKADLSGPADERSMREQMCCGSNMTNKRVTKLTLL